MPSICPEATRFGMPPSARRNAANLSDDEPALRVRITESKMRHSAALATVKLAKLRELAGDEPGAIVLDPARHYHRRLVPERRLLPPARRSRPLLPHCGGQRTARRRVAGASIVRRPR